ncbi:MAG TPA: GreA/GreB family elongation factor [Chitinophagaceae bacterium]
MQTVKNQLVLREDDYQIMIAHLRGSYARSSFDKRNAEELEAELKKAKLVSKENFPGDVVRLNSIVKIKDDEKDKIMELTLVTPEKANIRERKISVMAPIGTALIGFRKGQKVKWQVPSGEKTFVIMEVTNHLE